MLRFALKKHQCLMGCVNKRGDNVTIGNISTIFGLVGVAGFFGGNITLVALGGIASGIRLLILTVRNEYVSQGTIMLYIVLGIMTASYTGLPHNIGVFIGLCFESAISGAISFALSAKNETD